MTTSSRAPRTRSSGSRDSAEAEILSAWAFPRPVLAVAALVTVAGALYTFKFGWTKAVYFLTGIAFAVTAVGTIARAAGWTEAATQDVPIITMVFILAFFAACWPVLLVLSALAAEFYLLYRSLKYMFGGSGALAGGMLILMLLFLASPLLVLGLFIIWWLLSTLVGTPVYW